MSKLINLLAIDTAADVCSAALYVDHKIIERYEWAPKAHARLLLPLVDSLLQEGGISLSNVDVFAFGRGPGSFTGVRIACSVIQALSFGMNKPVVPISNLRAQAQRAYRILSIDQVFASIDARMQEIYWGLFKADEQGMMQAMTEERVEPLQQVILPPGSCWHKVVELPRAEDIARLALFDYAQGYQVSALEVLPVYLRDEVVKK